MLLVEHCGTYLYPVLKNMKEYEQFFGMSQPVWDTLPQETKAKVGKRFLQEAETRIIVGASDCEKRRIAEIYGKHVPGWYQDECEDKGLPVRFTSPH